MTRTRGTKPYIFTLDEVAAAFAMTCPQCGVSPSAGIGFLAGIECYQGEACPLLAKARAANSEAGNTNTPPEPAE